MKQINLLLVILLGYTGVIMSWPVSPELGLLLVNPERANALNAPVLLKTDAGQVLETIIRFNGSVSELSSFGRVRCVHDNIAIVQVPLEKLNDMATSPVVQYAELSRVDKPLLNISTDAINARAARSQYGYTGSGVIVGIIDSGIDWSHEDFVNPDGSSRISHLLDFSSLGDYYDGRLYTRQEINSALAGGNTVFEHDYSGHGTHVAGIAAGDGSDNAQTGDYAGVAPDADLVIVKAARNMESSEFTTADQIIALHFIDSVATALNKPYVVNMSLGGHWGAHNGTTIVEQMIDNLTGPGIPGKAVVTVAGNEGDIMNHAKVAFGRETVSKDITLEIPDYYPTAGTQNDIVVLDLWYNANQDLTLSVITPGGSRIGPVRKGQYQQMSVNDGTVYAWNGFYDDGGEYYSGLDPIIGAYEMYIELRDDREDRPPASGTWTIRIAGKEANVDAWIAAVTNSGMSPYFVEGAVTSGRVSTPGTANNAITVGAYVSKKNWVDLDGNDLTFDSDDLVQLGDIAEFSSPGPTRDNRIKPEITAPGHIIASSYSVDAPPYGHASIFYSGDDFPNGYVSTTGRQALSSGTSMAGPHVTGAIALIFEQYHDSTSYPSATQLRTMLTESANRDAYVGSVPNEYWGYGKLDVVAALQERAIIETPTDYELMNIYPNPFNDTAVIEFTLPSGRGRQQVEIVAYNILGQRVRSIVTNRIANGGKVAWDGRDDLGYRLASGVYFVELKSNSFHQIKKIMLLGTQ